MKMTTVDIKCSTYIYFDVENNDKNYVRISKYKNVFANSYVPN